MEFPRYYNAAVDLIDGNVAAGRGDKVAFVDPRRSITFEELKSATNQVANLLGDLGIERETRVAGVSPREGVGERRVGVDQIRASENAESCGHGLE